MGRSLLSDFGVFLVFLLIISAPRSAVAFLPQNTKIAFDATNTLIFEDVGRHDGFSGDHILLHVTRDGKTFSTQTIRVTGLEDLKKPESIKVSITPSAPNPPRIN